MIDAALLRAPAAAPGLDLSSPRMELAHVAPPG